MLAVIPITDAQPADALLDGAAALLMQAQRRVAGCVQIAIAPGQNLGQNLDQNPQQGQPPRRLRQLRVFDGSADPPIQQYLGAGATGCSLDAAALAMAVARVAEQVPGADALILNRFGRSEATGGGFRPVIAAALLAGVPVLTAVPDRYRAAFDDFAGGLAEWLPPDPAALADWWRAQGVLPGSAR